MGWDTALQRLRKGWLASNQMKICIDWIINRWFKDWRKGNNSYGMSVMWTETNKWYKKQSESSYDLDYKQGAGCKRWWNKRAAACWNVQTTYSICAPMWPLYFEPVCSFWTQEPPLSRFPSFEYSHHNVSCKTSFGLFFHLASHSAH